MVNSMLTQARWLQSLAFDCYLGYVGGIVRRCVLDSLVASKLTATTVGWCAAGVLIGLFTILTGKYCADGGGVNRTGEWDEVFVGYQPSRDPRAPALQATLKAKLSASRFERLW